MSDIKISEMMEMQKKLWEKNKEKWLPMQPEYAKTMMLWMIEEIGESIAIIKKQGDKKIMEDTEVRIHFLEEMSDVMMYYFDTLQRYGVKPEEISDAYVAKHKNNLNRSYKYNELKDIK